MKKILILSLALSLALCACGKNKPAQTTGAVTTPEPVVTIPMAATTEDITITDAPETTAGTDMHPAYTAVKETPEYGDGVTVEYDVLTLDDEEIDQLLKAEADAALARHIPNISSVSADGGNADYYSVMSSLYNGGNIVSAVFNGAYSVSYGTGAASESRGIVLYTVNIDKESGELLDGGDIIADFDKMTAMFETGAFTAQGAEPYASDLSQYRTEYGIYPYVSMDENNFYLYVSESGVSEFYTAYSISLEEAGEFLNVKYAKTDSAETTEREEVEE